MFWVVARWFLRYFEWLLGCSKVFWLVAMVSLGYSKLFCVVTRVFWGLLGGCWVVARGS